MDVLVLNSGGYDSHVCMQLSYDLGYNPQSIFFDYGQKTLEKERYCALRMASKFNNNSFHPSEYFHEYKVNAPWILNYEKSNYFPMRNFIFLSNALSYAEAKGIKKVIFGIVDADNPYPDTTETFCKHIEDIYRSVGVELWCPLQYMGKGDVYILGGKLGVNINDTWSCDYSDDKPCGKCGNCQDMKLGIEEGLIPKIEFLE